MLPRSWREELLAQVERVRDLHERDRSQSMVYIRTVQALLGHKDVRTTMMIHTHMAKSGPYGVRSPLDNREVTRSPFFRSCQHHARFLPCWTCESGI